MSLAKRTEYYDCLRVFAILAVIVMHAAGRCANLSSPDDLQWQICTAFVSINRWAVPVFVMISGALFLDFEKEISIKSLYSKYILRIAIAYLTWSCIYTLCFSTFKYYEGLSLLSIWNTVAGTIQGGSAHLWFLWMLLGLYIILPVLRSAIRYMNERTLEYWLIISFLVCFCIPLLCEIDFIDGLIGDNVILADVGFLGGYVFYFVFGYYLSVTVVNEVRKKNLYRLAIVCIVFTVVAVAVQSYCQGQLVGIFRENLTPNIAAISGALFLFCKDKYRDGKQSRVKTVCVHTSKYVFGIYLIHNLYLDTLGINILRFLENSMPLSIIMWILVFVTVCLSLVTIILISKIKPLAKYII